MLTRVILAFVSKPAVRSWCPRFLVASSASLYRWMARQEKQARVGRSFFKIVAKNRSHRSAAIVLRGENVVAFDLSRSVALTATALIYRREIRTVGSAVTLDDDLSFVRTPVYSRAEPSQAMATVFKAGLRNGDCVRTGDALWVLWNRYHVPRAFVRASMPSCGRFTDHFIAPF